jgi:hypothetical protein
MGITLLAALIWRQLGRDAGRAIAVGVGAGAFEAFLLGIGPVATAVALMFVKGPEMDRVREQLETIAATTPIYWLAAPVERIVAILCHASTRALIILGVVHKKYLFVFGGFLLFTLLDGIVGALHVAGMVGTISLWWIELAILPFGIVSVPILVWCYRRWPEQAPDPSPILAVSEESGAVREKAVDSADTE